MALEEFSGIAKCCRSVDGEYLMGIQRTTREKERSSPPNWPTSGKRTRPSSSSFSDVLKRIPERQASNLHELLVRHSSRT